MFFIKNNCYPDLYYSQCALVSSYLYSVHTALDAVDCLLLCFNLLRYRKAGKPSAQ